MADVENVSIVDGVVWLFLVVQAVHIELVVDGDEEILSVAEA